MHRKKSNPATEESIEWPPVTEGSQLEAVNAFKARALALPASDVIPMRLDAELCYVNVSLGERSLRRVADRLFQLPGVASDYFETLRGALLATYFQADMAARTRSEKVSATLDLAELRTLRMILKTSLEACAAKGLFKDTDAAELKEIARGTGSLDAAQDCIRYAAFFRKHGKILQNKTPVEPSDLVRAEELGQHVRDHLALEGGIRSTQTNDTRDAIELRDRFFTLLVNAYSLGERAAPFLFGKDYKDAVPSMQSRRGLVMLNRKPKTKTDASAPSSEG